MDPVRNPYAPGAGQRPPELAGRDRELGAFDVVLERVARGRPERSLVLTGLRGVGKTVLLGELRSMAVRAGWGAGKIEARPDADLRRPLSAALHRAVRDLAIERFGVLAREVLEYWGIRRTEDVGDVVFALVDLELLAAQPNDTRDDFAGVYDFDAAFARDYPWRCPALT